MHARRNFGFVLCGVALVCGLGVCAAAETIVEKHPNGKVKVRYVTDGPRGKHGAYAEFTDKGLKKVTATYKDGKLNGPLTQFENGVAVWVQPFKDGQPVFGQSLEQVRKKLAELDPPLAKDATMAVERDAALRRLKAYRYLVGVPYDNVVLDADMNLLCEARAKLCEKLGRIEHTPANPGLPEADYQVGFKGTSNANLAHGCPDLRRAVDEWMEDSDAGNIDHVGHRRWCLNPAMGKTGFGRSAAFSAMWSPDKSQKIVPDYNFIAYPAAAFMPAEYFHPRHAWSVTYNPQKFKVPDSVKAGIFEVDELLNKTETVKLDFQGISRANAGVSNCVIFRPEKIDLSPGKRYLVQVDGLTLVTGAPIPPHRYLVEFVKLDEPK